MIQFNKFKSEKHIPILAFLCICLFVGFSLYRDYRINKCSKIFLCVANNISGGPKTGYNLHFSYFVNNKKMEGLEMIDKEDYRENNDEYYINKRFFVSVACDNYSFTRLIWDIKVPDTLKYYPINGWDKVPYELDNSK